MNNLEELMELNNYDYDAITNTMASNMMKSWNYWCLLCHYVVRKRREDDTYCSLCHRSIEL